MEIGLMSTQTSKLHRFGNTVMNLQTSKQIDVEEENSERPLLNKEIVETNSVLRKVVQHRADEKESALSLRR